MESINPKCESCQTLAFKNQIISAILNAKNTNQGIQNYRQCLENDFREFANQEDSLQEEAEALFRLQEIQKELELIASCPLLYTKTIVAVGGGFSAGKSEFISSFFQEGEAKLAIGIEPMTAIPTYVINGEEQGLIGCTSNGASVDLTKIDPQIQSKMSHSFIKSFDFNLRSIMPFAVLQTKLNQYQNLCFVDTPGYNPSEVADGYTGEDVKTAKDFLNNAEILLWLIGLDANGTISRSDLDFLKKLNLEDKKLYIILNKADLKMPSAIENIMQEVASTLEFEDVVYEGISAYSSRRKKEIAYRKISLLEFLAQNNTKSKFHEKIVRELYEVKSMYRYAILKNIKEQKTILSTLKSLSLDLYEEGVEDENHPALQRIEKLKQCFNTQKYEDNLVILDSVIDKFKNAIDEVFLNSLHISFEELSEDEISLDVDMNVCDYERKKRGDEEYKKAIDYYKKKRYQEAIVSFEDAVRLGVFKAYKMMGDMCYFGKGFKKSYAKAKEFYELAISRGDAGACKSLGDMYYNGIGVSQNYSEAKNFYKLALERGDETHSNYFYLGWIYQNIDCAYIEAREMYKRGAELNHGMSCKSLGDMYYNGIGVQQDLDRAKEYYEQAVKRKIVEAYKSLGDMYYNGIGVQQDLDRAKEYYELIIEGECKEPSVYFHLAQIYEKKGFQPKCMYEIYEKAAILGCDEAYSCLVKLLSQSSMLSMFYSTHIENLLKKAVENGSVNACKSLGDMYYNGIGVSRDCIKAKELYEKVIHMGHNEGEIFFKVGYIYQYVEEPRNYAKAKMMYEKAIELGCGTSCYYLGKMYYDGNGVQMIYVKAKELYELGASRENEECKKALRELMVSSYFS